MHGQKNIKLNQIGLFLLRGAYIFFHSSLGYKATEVGLLLLIFF